MMWALLTALLACVLVFVAVLQFWSYPGRPRPFVDEKGAPLAGSISEKIYLDINGVKQGMFLKGRDITNPVLLYLHGGMPDYFLAEKYPTGLEDDFTVAWWEQRGSGISYSPEVPAATITAEQLIADTLAVTDYLRHRFGQEKIYLMGHSGGTFFGIQAAARAPERYHAYIGVAQMSNQLESERLAYEYMLQQFKEQGNAGMVRKLEAAPVTRVGGTPKDYLALRDGAMHSLGIGTTHDMRSVLSGIFLASWQSRDYTLGEKFNTWRGKIQAGVSVLWQEVMITDLSKEVTGLAIPVYFLHGVHDYTCAYAVGKSYFDQISAPIKGFYTFDHSAHSPIFEEPARVQQIMRKDILVGGNSLADANRLVPTR